MNVYKKICTYWFYNYYYFCECGHFSYIASRVIFSYFFITKKRAAKIGRNIKKNIAVHIPEHYIPAFKPAKEFVAEVKKIKEIKPDAGPGEEGV